MKKELKKGMYETVYGNVAFVSGKNAKSAYDVDAGEHIPISMVCADRFVRSATNQYS